MTEVFIKSDACMCDPNECPNKRLVLVEGQTSIWACVHTKRFTMQHTTEFVEKK
jgi:hypothetical protein